LREGQPERENIEKFPDRSTAGKTVREYYSNAETYAKVNISAWKRFGFDESLRLVASSTGSHGSQVDLPGK
jgi:hypothetical protein